jgi:hypothetical protein
MFDVIEQRIIRDRGRSVFKARVFRANSRVSNYWKYTFGDGGSDFLLITSSLCFARKVFSVCILINFLRKIILALNKCNSLVHNFIITFYFTFQLFSHLVLNSLAHQQS